MSIESARKELKDLFGQFETFGKASVFLYIQDVKDPEILRKIFQITDQDENGTVCFSLKKDEEKFKVQFVRLGKASKQYEIDIPSELQATYTWLKSERR